MGYRLQLRATTSVCRWHCQRHTRVQRLRAGTNKEAELPGLSYHVATAVTVANAAVSGINACYHGMRRTVGRARALNAVLFAFPC